jgi:hypothetical protein
MMVHDTVNKGFAGGKYDKSMQGRFGAGLRPRPR